MSVVRLNDNNMPVGAQCCVFERQVKLSVKSHKSVDKQKALISQSLKLDRSLDCGQVNDLDKAYNPSRHSSRTIRREANPKIMLPCDFIGRAEYRYFISGDGEDSGWRAAILLHALFYMRIESDASLTKFAFRELCVEFEVSYEYLLNVLKSASECGLIQYDGDAYYCQELLEDITKMESKRSEWRERKQGQRNPTNVSGDNSVTPIVVPSGRPEGRTQKTEEGKEKKEEESLIQAKGMKHLRATQADWLKLGAKYGVDVVKAQLEYADRWIEDNKTSDKNARKYARKTHNHYMFLITWMNNNIPKGSAAPAKSEPKSHVKPFVPAPDSEERYHNQMIAKGMVRKQDGNRVYYERAPKETAQ